MNHALQPACAKYMKNNFGGSGWGGGGGRAPPLSHGPKFSQFHEVFWKFWKNRMLAPPRVIAPHRGNPGPTPEQEGHFNRLPTARLPTDVDRMTDGQIDTTESIRTLRWRTVMNESHRVFFVIAMRKSLLKERLFFLCAGLLLTQKVCTI